MAKGLLRQGQGECQEMPIDRASSESVAAVTTVGHHQGFNGIHSKGFQSDSISPVDSTVAFGLDDRFLSRPSQDMGWQIIRSDELLFAGVEILGAHPQHLRAIHLFRIQADDAVRVQGQCHHERRMADADVHGLALNMRCSLLIMG